MGVCGSSSAKSAREAQAKKQDSEQAESAESKEKGISVYIRIAGLDLERMKSDSYFSGTLQASLTCDVAEAAQTAVSSVKDLERSSATLYTVPCHPSHGLVFGAFISADDIQAPGTVEAIAALLNGDAARAGLKKSAAFLALPDGTVLVGCAAVCGEPDLPESPGKHCPWDLQKEADWPPQDPAEATDNNLKRAMSPTAEKPDEEPDASDQLQSLAAEERKTETQTAEDVSGTPEKRPLAADDAWPLSCCNHPAIAGTTTELHP